MVILIIGILVSFAIPQIANLQDRANLVEAIIMVDRIHKYHEMYILEHEISIEDTLNSNTIREKCFSELGIHSANDVTPEQFNENIWVYSYSLDIDGEYNIHAYRVNWDVLREGQINDLWFTHRPSSITGSFIETMGYNHKVGYGYGNVVFIKGSMEDLLQ